MPGFGSLAPQTPDDPYPDEGAGMPETYQSPLGKMALAMARGIYQIPQRLAEYAETPAGLRREDVTDIPAGRTVTGGAEFGAEPQDQLIKGTAGSAINRLLPGGLPFAARGGLGAFGGRMIQRAAPEEAASGIMPQLEKVLQALADKHGVDPRYFQEVAWAGAKDAKTKGGYVAKPMIQHVNDAIERTRRITGLDPGDIVRRGLVRSEIPLYGAAGAVAAPVFGSLASRSQE